MRYTISKYLRPIGTICPHNKTNHVRLQLKMGWEEGREREGQKRSAVRGGCERKKDEICFSLTTLYPTLKSDSRNDLELQQGVIKDVVW